MPLALFDDNIPLEMERLMVKALTAVEGSAQPVKRVSVNQSAAVIVEKCLVDFITISSLEFFATTDIERAFLRVEPAEWLNDLQHIAAQTCDETQCRK